MRSLEDAVSTNNKATICVNTTENALTIIFLNHAVSMFDAFITNIIENNEFNFNYYSNPLYNNYSNELNGINISILW